MKLFSIYYPSTRNAAFGPSRWESSCVWVGHADPKPARPDNVVELPRLDIPAFLRKQAE
jgi:hypothetical protein